jgi:uncharacterized membrane protein YgcG
MSPLTVGITIAIVIAFIVTIIMVYVNSRKEKRQSEDLKKELLQKQSERVTSRSVYKDNPGRVRFIDKEERNLRKHDELIKPIEQVQRRSGIVNDDNSLLNTMLVMDSLNHHNHTIEDYSHSSHQSDSVSDNSSSNDYGGGSNDYGSSSDSGSSDSGGGGSFGD